MKPKDIPIRTISAIEEKPEVPDHFSIKKVLIEEKDVSQELHRHDFFYLLILQKGSGIHEIDFTNYQVQDRSVFFMRPGQVHQHTLKAASHGFLAAFDKDFFAATDEATLSTLHKASKANHCQLEPEVFERAFSLFKNIYEEHTSKQEGNLHIIRSYLSIFFTEFVRHQKNEALSPTNTYNQERFEEFATLLESQIFSQKQVAYYADSLSLSPWQLNSITKSIAGKTCSELINEQILLESKRHLLATSNQVNQIAHLLGYDDVSYFIRFFKKHTGFAPESFRNNFR